LVTAYFGGNFVYSKINHMNTFNTVCVSAAAPCSKQLHELNTARNSLGDSGGSAILSASPWNSLRKLWLGSNALTCASLEHLRGSSIQLLDLSFKALTPTKA
jgi:hypothetical protein